MCVYIFPLIPQQTFWFYTNTNSVVIYIFLQYFITILKWTYNQIIFIDCFGFYVELLCLCIVIMVFWTSGFTFLEEISELPLIIVLQAKLMFKDNETPWFKNKFHTSQTRQELKFLNMVKSLSSWDVTNDSTRISK